MQQDAVTQVTNQNREHQLDALLDKAYPGIHKITKMPLGWFTASARIRKFTECYKIDSEKALLLLDMFRFTEEEKTQVIRGIVNTTPDKALEFFRIISEVRPEFQTEIISKATVENLQKAYLKEPVLFKDHEHQVLDRIAENISSINEIPYNVKSLSNEAQTRIITIFISKLTEDRVDSFLNEITEYKYDSDKINSALAANKKLHTFDNYKKLRKSFPDFNFNDCLVTIANNDPNKITSNIKTLQAENDIIPALIIVLKTKGFSSKTLYAESIKLAKKHNKLDDIIDAGTQANPVAAFSLLSASNLLTPGLKDKYFQAALESKPAELFALATQINLTPDEKEQIICHVLKKSFDQALALFNQANFTDDKKWNVWSKFNTSAAEESINRYSEFQLAKRYDDDFFNVLLRTDPVLALGYLDKLSFSNKEESCQTLFNAIRRKDKFLAAQNAGKLGIIDSIIIVDLVESCIKESAKKTLELVIPHITITDSEALERFAISCADKQNWLTFENIEHFKLNPKSEAYSTIMRKGLESDPYRILDNIKDLALVERTLVADIIKSCVDKNQKLFTENIERFLPYQDQVKQAFIELTAKQVNPKFLLSILEKLPEIKNDSELIVSLIGKLEDSPFDKLDLFTKYKLISEPLIESIVFDGILKDYDQEKWKTFLVKYLPDLTITDIDLRRKIATKIFDGLYTTGCAEFSCFGLAQHDTREDAAKFREGLALKSIEKEFTKETTLCAVVKHLEKFELDNHDAILEALISKKIGANVVNYLPYLPKFKLVSTINQQKRINIINNYMFKGTLDTKTYRGNISNEFAARAKVVIKSADELKNNLSPADFFSIVHVIAKHSPGEFLENKDNLISTDNTRNRYLARGVAVRDPAKALTFYHSLGDHDEFTEAIIRTKLASIDPASAMKRIRSRINHPRCLEMVALAIGKKDFKFLAANYIKLGIKDDAISEKILAKLETQKKCVAVENIELFGIINHDSIGRLVEKTASTDIRTALDYSQNLTLSGSFEFLNKAFISSLTGNNLLNAVEIARVYNSKPGRSELESLKLFCSHNVVDENQRVKHAKGLFLRCVNSNLMPDKVLIKAFDLFDDKTDVFISKLLGTAGPTFGKQIISELQLIYKKKDEEVTISKEDQDIIMIFVEMKFRGFSADTFKHVKGLVEKTRTVDSVRQQISKWTKISEAVLSGESLDPNLVKDPYFPLLVYNAYKPVGIDLDGLKGMLTQIKDNSDHLTVFPNIRKDGYDIILRDISKLKLKNDQALDHTKMDFLKNLVASASAEQVTPEGFAEILLLASKKNLNAGSASQILGYFINNSADTRLKHLIAKIGNIKEKSLNDCNKLLSHYSDFLNAFEEDVIDEILAKIPEYSTEVTANVSNRTRQSEVTKEIITEQLRNSFVNFIEDLHKQVESELSKFEGEFSGAESTYKMFIKKDKAAYFGRAGAGLCTATENWSWNNENFLQMIMVDTNESLIVGNVQLHVFKDPDGKKSVLARVNPTSKFLSKANKEKLAEQLLKTVHEFADSHELRVYMPQQTYWHPLTNRTEFSSSLMAYFGRGRSHRVQITAGHTVEYIYQSTYPEKKN